MTHRPVVAGLLLAALLGFEVAPCRADAALVRPAPPHAWFEGQRPRPQAQVAVALLGDAASHGLDPLDYGLPALSKAIDDALHGPPLAEAAAEQLDQALSAALKRFLQEIHSGRVRPTQIGQRWSSALPDRAPFDASAALRAALALQDPALAVRQATPPLAQYQRLREALVQYRSMVGHPAWQQDLPRPLLPIEPGAAWPAVLLLASRLTALGDLPPGEPAGDARLEGALVDALKAFQQRHGLAADGVVGRATWAALQVPPAQRLRQIELALERLRWTPLLRGPRMIVINIPEFVLRAFEVQGERIAIRAQMKVIVGRSLDTRTPLIGEDLQRIEFRPHWNVPASIARKELVPRLRRDSAHWAREGFEFVTGTGGADAELSEAKLQAVLAGALRIRQRPGPRNALGDIKFVFPNRESVYLHHTPSSDLFQRARRDFSHGCIRVEHPAALAGFALQGLPGWTPERIERAMTSDAPATVSLNAPLPVLIAYGTALVKEGRVHFFEDIYGHDRRLEAALRLRQRASN